MEKFIIMNVHDATPKKTPKIILNFFPFFLLVYFKKFHVKRMINFLIWKYYYYYEILWIFYNYNYYFKQGLSKF